MPFLDTAGFPCPANLLAEPRAFSSPKLLSKSWKSIHNSAPEASWTVGLCPALEPTHWVESQGPHELWASLNACVEFPNTAAPFSSQEKIIPHNGGCFSAFGLGTSVKAHTLSAEAGHGNPETEPKEGSADSRLRPL